MLRRRLLVPLAFLAGMLALSPAASAQVPPPTLTGEEFLGGVFAPPGQSSVTVTSANCDPTGTSTFTYQVSGPATGPYVGLYNETGTVSMGPQIFGVGDPLHPPTALVTSWTANFTITGSPLGTVSGSKSLPPNPPPITGICSEGGTFFAAQRAAATGVQNALHYTATITASGGAQYGDSGTSNASVNEFPTNPAANDFFEDFASEQLATTPICDQNSQTNQNQTVNTQGCKNP